MHCNEHLSTSDIVRIKLEIERDLRQLIESLKAEVNRKAIQYEELRKLIETLNNGGVSYEDVQKAVNDYLDNTTLETGATPEQAAQINANVEQINANVAQINANAQQINANAEALSSLANSSSEINARVSSLEGEEKVKPSDLSSVATSGNYDDLNNAPTALKNPHPLTINGTTYDGSKAVNVSVTAGTGTGSSVTVDKTLSISGAAADAAKVGELLNEQKEANDAQDEAIAKKLNASELPTAINTALAQAKESGQFDGAPGAKGDPGDDYVLTESDKEEIAEMAAELVEVPEGGGSSGGGLVSGGKFELIDKLESDGTAAVYVHDIDMLPGIYLVKCSMKQIATSEDIDMDQYISYKFGSNDPTWNGFQLMQHQPSNNNGVVRYANHYLFVSNDNKIYCFGCNSYCVQKVGADSNNDNTVKTKQVSIGSKSSKTVPTGCEMKVYRAVNS